MKVGDKVTIIEAWFSKIGGLEYDCQYTDLIGAEGIILKVSEVYPHIYDWEVVFTKPMGYNRHWWFATKHLKLTDPQMFIQFSEEHV
jgi:hypothetical protein